MTNANLDNLIETNADMITALRLQLVGSLTTKARERQQQRDEQQHQQELESIWGTIPAAN